MNRSAPYGRINWRNHKFDNRTQTAIAWAEKNYIRRAPLVRKRWNIVQGSYNTGVDASSGTHNGGGSMDLSTSGMSERQKRATIKWLRKAGWAAWIRRAIPNVWGEHIHAVLLGHRTASPGAKQQMVAYLNHRDGLAGNRYDGTWRPSHRVRWSHRQNRPVRV